MTHMDDLVTLLESVRLVPVVTIHSADDAGGLGEALLAGGLPIAEITFRTDAAERAIAAMRRTQPGVCVGAGTVLDVETVKRAVGAGAVFVVAPGFNPAVVDHCRENGIPVVPGVATPTEIEMGLGRGLSFLKFFPAEASGGVAMLKAVAAPYGGVRFMPTGGISPANLAAYLACPEVVACGGSWIATTDAIANHRFDEISTKAGEAVACIRDLVQARTAPAASGPAH